MCRTARREAWTLKKLEASGASTGNYSDVGIEGGKEKAGWES